MTALFERLTSSLGRAPVLVDVGASGATPKIWEPIAKRSIFVGFDPDLREMREVTGETFSRAIIVNEAVVADESLSAARFYFTRSPFCSSTLPPDTSALSAYIFSELFKVEREGEVRASTLNSVLKRLSLDRIDWLKVDSQGTDLRLLKSLDDAVRASVLAVDIEPGLIDAYVGEDLFVDSHKELVKEGFWLSDLKVCGTVRMRQSTLQAIRSERPSFDERLIHRALRTSPGWCEARYLRSAEWLSDRGAQRADYVLLWIFAAVERQWGFALDLTLEAERRFGPSTDWRDMKEHSIVAIRTRATPAFSLPRRVARRILGKLQQL